MRMPFVVMGLLLIRNNVMIVVVVELKQVQPGIMMESPRPDHKGKDGEKSHQETVLTSKHEKRIVVAGQKSSALKKASSVSGTFLTIPLSQIAPLEKVQ